MKWLRPIAAFLLAPLVAGVASLIASFIGSPPALLDLASLIPYILILGFFGLAGEILVGLPLLVLGYRKRYLGLPLFLLGGAIAAGGLGLFFSLSQTGITVGWFFGMVLTPALIAALFLWVAGGWSSNHSLHRTRPLRREV